MSNQTKAARIVYDWRRDFDCPHKEEHLIYRCAESCLVQLIATALRAERQTVWEEAAKYLVANDACYKLQDGSCHDVELCGIETAKEFRRRATEAEHVKGGE